MYGEPPTSYLRIHYFLTGPPCHFPFQASKHGTSSGSEALAFFLSSTLPLTRPPLTYARELSKTVATMPNKNPTNPGKDDVIKALVHIVTPPFPTRNKANQPLFVFPCWCTGL